MSGMDVPQYEVRIGWGCVYISLTSSSVPFGDKSVWKKIWKCKVPLKVRIFAWKSLSNGLATEANKKRRHIPVSGQCRICGHDSEDSFHALIQCPHAAALWAAMWDVWDIPVWKGGRRRDWFEQWIISLQDEMCNRVLMIAWRIWYARNEVIHESLFQRLKARGGLFVVICSPWIIFGI
jgi:hypothetical protein